MGICKVSKRIAVLTNKVVLMFTMKAYGEAEGRAPHILALVLDGGEWSASRYSRFNPREINSSPIEWKTVWAPQQFWTFWRRDKFLVTTDTGMPDRPARCAITALTTLRCFPNKKIYCVV